MMLSRSTTSNRSLYFFNKTRKCLVSSSFINNSSLDTSNAIPSSRSMEAHFVSSSSSRNNNLVHHTNRNQYYWNGSFFSHRFKSVVAASSSHDSSTDGGSSSSSAHTISSTNENEEEEEEETVIGTTPTTTVVDFDDKTSYNNVVSSNDEEEQTLLEEEEDEEEEEEKESKTSTWVLGSTWEGIDDEQYNIDIYEAYFKYETNIPEPLTIRELEQIREEKYQSKISKLERLLNVDVAYEQDDTTTTTRNQKQRRGGKRDNRTTQKQGSSVNEYQVVQLYYQIDAASDKKFPFTSLKLPLELHLDVMEFLIRRHCINEAFKVLTTLESIRFSEQIKVQAIRLLMDGLKNQSKLTLGSYHGTIRRHLQSKILSRPMLRTYYKQLFDIILRENHKELLPELLVSIVAHRERDTVLGNLSRQVYEHILMMDEAQQQEQQQQQQQDEGDQNSSTTSSSLIHPKWLYDVLKETSNNNGYSSKFIGHQPYVYDETRGEHVTYTEESMDYYVRTNAVSGNSTTRNDNNHNNNDSTAAAAAAPLPIDDVLQRLVFDFNIRPHPMVITKLLEAEHPYCHNPQRLSNILDCVLHLIRTTPTAQQQQQHDDEMNDFNNEEQQKDFTTTTMMESSMTDDESETVMDTVEEEEEDGDDITMDDSLTTNNNNNNNNNSSRQRERSLPPYVYRFENGLMEQLFIMCSRWGDPEMVLKLWDIVDFYAAQKKPTIEMYESTIQTFIATSKTTDKQAFAVMKEMEFDQGLEVSHAMIRNIARSLRVSDVRLENAHRIVTYVDRHTGTGVASVSSYNCLLAAYAEMGNVPKTFELFDEMSSQYGLKANMYSYSCLLESLANHLKTITLRPGGNNKKQKTKRTTQSFNDDSNNFHHNRETISFEEQSKLDSVVESADGIMNMIRRDQEERQQQQSSTLIADQDNGLCLHQYIRILCFRGNVERALEVLQMIHYETTSSTTTTNNSNSIRLDTYCCIAAQAATLQKFHVAAQACQLILDAGYTEVPPHVQSIIKQQGQKKPRM